MDDEPFSASSFFCVHTLTPRPPRFLPAQMHTSRLTSFQALEDQAKGHDGGRCSNLTCGGGAEGDACRPPSCLVQ